MLLSKRPVIGLPGRRKTGRDIVGSPETLLDIPVDLYMADYASGVYEAGGLPLHLPFDIDLEQAIDLLDGLLLTGGADVSPALYGATPDPELLDPESLRDNNEMGLLDAAAAGGMPVLGICRGIQILNVHGGGTLHQHVPEHARFDGRPGDPVHNVVFDPGSNAARLYGESLPVNSLHHQTIAELSPSFVATGIADDGVIEVIESLQHRWMGLQWHPEMMPTRPHDPIFVWLIEQARNLTH